MHPHIVDVDIILSRIRNGHNLQQIKLIREAKDKKTASKLKAQLPCVLFAGTFTDTVVTEKNGKVKQSKRTDKSIVKHSGLICLDFDKMPFNELLKIKAEICKDEYTFACFISPSGLGLKVLVQIPPSIENHREHFKALEDHFNSEYFDSSSINISRVCYESYDKNIYINKKSKVFTARKKQPVYENTAPIQANELNDNETYEKLKIWIGKKSLSGRNNEVYELSKAMKRYGINQDIAARLIISDYSQKDFDAKEIKTTVNSGYNANTAAFNTQSFSSDRKKYVVYVKTKGNEKKLQKFYTDNLHQFSNELDSKFPYWRFANVFNNDTEKSPQIGSFTRNNRPKNADDVTTKKAAD